MQETTNKRRREEGGGLKVRLSSSSSSSSLVKTANANFMTHGRFIGRSSLLDIIIKNRRQTGEGDAIQNEAVLKAA